MSEKYWDDGLVKSTERVKDAGEVFTPFNIIEDMLDLLPADAWEVHPSKTFLEPSCGNGRFLVVALYRKINRIQTSSITSSQIPVLALEALASIYGIDISEDNVLGHIGEEHDGARGRLVKHFNHLLDELNVAEKRDELTACAKWIVDHNVIVGNMLPTDSKGKPTNRDEMPFLDYVWEPESSSVEIFKTDWLQIQENSREDDGALNLNFGTSEEPVYAGPALNLHSANKVVWTPKGIIPRGKR